MRLFFLFAFLCVSTSLFGQYAVSEIPQDIMGKSNAIVRNDHTEVVLRRYNKMEVSYKRVVTVFNRLGLEALNTSFTYDSAESIGKIEAVMYDKNGKQIKKYKKKDFTDVSASGGYLYVDNRNISLDVSPPYYPFTLAYYIEYTSTTTAVLPGFNPITHTDMGVQKCTYKLVNEANILIKKVESNLDVYNVKKSEADNILTYSVSNIGSFESEDLAPDLRKFLPIVKLSPKRFTLAGVSGDVDSWKSFGLWQYRNLLQGMDELDSGIVSEIENLVAGASSDKEKSKLIYEYVQNKTRYVNIAIGIGGWKPAAALKVHELSYGDCKGLTNYTRALLNSQGITSYYTVVDSGSDGQDLDENFVAMQGNHVILTVPFENEHVYLECTSQHTPYNYLGTFTDDRKVLMVTPEGGVLTKTTTYKTKDNIQKLEASATLSQALNLTGNLVESSEGIRYGNKYTLEQGKTDEIVMYYRELWGHLDNFEVANVVFENDKENIVFTEKLTFETSNYVSTAGDRVLVNPNIFNRYQYIPDREKNRKLPMEIRRGTTYIDKIEIILPDKFEVEAIFDPIEITSPFGNYRAEVTLDKNSKLIYNRTFVLESGTYPKESYDKFVSFLQQVVKKDKSKIVLNRL